MKRTTFFIALTALLASCHYGKFKSHCSNPTMLVIYITSGSYGDIYKLEPDSSNVDSVAVLQKYELYPYFTTQLYTDTFNVKPFVKQKSLILSSKIPNLLTGDYLITLYPSARQYRLTEITSTQSWKWVSNYDYGSSYAECSNGLSIKINDSVHSQDWEKYYSEVKVFWVKY